MLMDTRHTRLPLQRGQATHLPKAHAAHVCSAEGTLWVTLDGDVKDFVLEPGQGLAVPGDRAVTISALSPQAVLALRLANGAQR